MRRGVDGECDSLGGPSDEERRADVHQRGMGTQKIGDPQTATFGRADYRTLIDNIATSAKPFFCKSGKVG